MATDERNTEDAVLGEIEELRLVSMGADKTG
jgi:hypothetical protein